MIVPSASSNGHAAVTQTANMRVLSEERRRAILDQINREGRAVVSTLAAKFGISEVTIRQDLEALDRRGLVHRTHGGALPVRTAALLDPSVQEKARQHRKEKQKIAAAAARLVKEGQSIVLDSGSTTTALAHSLRHFRQLTVITNAVNIANDLAGSKVEVILTGGILRENSFSLVGPLAEETLRGLNADLLFLGLDGFDPRVGPSTPNLLEAKVNRVMMEISRRTVAVCDSSKFARRSLSLIAPTAKVHQVITDRNISEADLRVLREAGVKVALV